MIHVVLANVVGNTIKYLADRQCGACRSESVEIMGRAGLKSLTQVPGFRRINWA